MGNSAKKISLTTLQRTADHHQKQSKSERKAAKKLAKDSNSRRKDCAWDRQLLEKQLYAAGHVTHAAIVGLDDRQLRAVVPPDFIPEDQGLRDISDALRGDTSGLAERGLSLGGSTPPCSPGKLDEGKVIYGSDGKEGGCVVLRTSHCALVVFYRGNPDSAVRAAEEAAALMEKNGR
jgi:hypothetical protein